VSRIAYISGRPGAGKSSLAVPLAAELGYSLLTKDMVKEALHDALYVPGEGTVEVHCACPAEVAHARYNARSRHEVHQRTLPLSAMDKYDRPVGIGPLITVNTTRPVDVAAIAAEIRRLHTS
jgi:predicted kinase